MFEDDDRRREDPFERVTARDAAEDVEKLAPAGVFGYAAGKSIIAKKLVKLFPAHKAYTEPFCGSAALYFTKEPVDKEVLNDRDKEVAFALNAIKTISKSDLERLAKMDWKGSAETFNRLKKSNPTDKVGRLYKFLYLINFSYGKGRSSFNPSAAGATSGAASRVAKFQPRMKHTLVTCGDYEKAIKDHDGKDAFHFIDPPYGGYSAGGGGVGEKEFDEARFRKILDGIKGQFLVTYGTKGKLDTSGFEVKRMRQPRTIRTMRGVGGDQFLTHLLISNFKVAKKSLGEGIELADVLQVIDTEGDDSRIMVTGSRTSVSVPERLEPARAWKNADPLLEYAAESGPVQGEARVRFLEKSWVVDLIFPVNDVTIGWSFAAQRAGAVGEPAAVAKSFSVEGSRHFAPLTCGVPARMTPAEVLAEAVEKLEHPEVELGLQTADLHEYFLSKGDELVGQLVVERDEKRPLGESYPWIATIIDSKFIPNAVIKGAPMPPDGVSALPAAVEKLVPLELRYWERRGDEARATRDALAASGFLKAGSLALVDGEISRVVTKVALYEPPAEDASAAGWPAAQVAQLVPPDTNLFEVYEGGIPRAGALVKAEAQSVAYVDVGVDVEGLALLVKSLGEYAGHYVVSATDSPAARDTLSGLGRLFQFRPDPEVGLGVEATKRLFVASFGVRSDRVCWVDKELDDSAAEWLRRRKERRKPTLVNEPSDDTPDLGKAEWSTAYQNDLPDSAFLHIEPGGEKDEEGKTKPRDLRHFPYRDKDGAVDRPHLTDAIGRIPQADIPADKKKTLQERARDLLDEHFKADELEKAKPHMLVVEKPDGSKATTEHSSRAAAQRAAVAHLQAHGGHGKVAIAPKGKEHTVQPVPARVSAGGDDYVRDEQGQFAGKATFKVLKADAAGDEHFVLGEVLVPDEVDAQKDTYSAPEVRRAAHRYMAEFQNRGLMHKELVNNQVDILESYIAPVDFTIGSQVVKAGTWVMGMRVKDAKLWNAVKDGGLTGFSIGGSANRQPDPAATSKFKARKEQAKKKIAFQGIPIVIDRPKGFVQHGVDDQGKPWTREYQTDYGYIPRTKGGDGEGLDVFVGPKDGSSKAFWVSQKKGDGSFDEYKLLLGYDSADDAKRVYEQHVPARFFGGMREGTVHQIKALLNQEPEEPLTKAIGKVLDGVAAL